MKYSGTGVFDFDFGLYGIDDIDHAKSKDMILSAFKREYGEQIAKRLAEVGLKYIGLEYYSPRFYNFENDSIDLELEIVDKTLLITNIEAKRDEIQEKLSANKSYDGYIAKTADNVDEVIEEINKEDDLDIIALSVLLKGVNMDIKSDFEIGNYFIYPEPCGECKACKEAEEHGLEYQHDGGGFVDDMGHEYRGENGEALFCENM